MRADQVRGAAAHLLGDQQFAAGFGDDPFGGLVGGALVGDLEVGDLVDLVTEEVDAHRVLGGRREDVDDAAAHRELAAPLDQVDPLVGGGDQVGGQLVERVLGTLAQFDRAQVRQVGDLGLQHRTHRGDDDLGNGPGVGALDPAQHGEAASDGVGTGAEAFVRQGLPGRVVGDLLVPDQRADGRRELLGLTEGRGDDQQHASGLFGDGREQGRTRGRRTGQVEGGNLGPGLLDGVGDALVGSQRLEKPRQTHRSRVVGRAKWVGRRPPPLNEDARQARA